MKRCSCTRRCLTSILMIECFANFSPVVERCSHLFTISLVSYYRRGNCQWQIKIARALLRTQQQFQVLPFFSFVLNDSFPLIWSFDIEQNLHGGGEKEGGDAAKCRDWKGGRVRCIRNPINNLLTRLVMPARVCLVYTVLITITHLGVEACRNLKWFTQLFGWNK